MILNNYTKIKKREKRVYAFFNSTISRTGIVTSTIYTCGVLLILFTILGLLFCSITGTFWYDPILLASTPKVLYFYLIFVGAPIGLGFMLNSVKVQNYKLIDYIKIYLIPKRAVDHYGKRVKICKYKVNGFIERIE